MSARRRDQLPENWTCQDQMSIDELLEEGLLPELPDGSEIEKETDS